MRETKSKEIKSNAILVNTDQLQEILGCGKVTAIKIGIQADAKLTIGKRVLWKVDKIKKYIEYAI